MGFIDKVISNICSIISPLRWKNLLLLKSRSYYRHYYILCVTLSKFMGEFRGESHIYFRTQPVIMTLAGGGFIVNGDLKMRKVIKFQSLCPATALV